MVDDSSAELRDVVIIGGGCYGSFYLGQLLAARSRRRVQWRSVLVVDRDPTCAAKALLPADSVTLVVDDWGAFLDRFLADGDRAPGDRIVPSPLMPHLLLEWLVRRSVLRHPAQPPSLGGGAAIGTPFESVGADGTRYVSHADWICPVHCVEPAICPATHAPRTWDMSETVRAAAPSPDGVALFACHHLVFGVGMIDVAGVLDADRALAAADGTRDVELLVGTVSRCHGAVTRLSIGARQRGPSESRSPR